MNILRCYLYLPPSKGGMENHVKNLSLQQDYLNNVTVAFNQGSEINCKQKPIRLLSKINLKKIKFGFFRDFLFYFSLFFLLLRRNKNFQVIHIHGDWSAFLCGWVISIFFEIPVKVASVHGKLKENYIFKKLYCKTLKKYSFIYCTGMNQVQYLKKIGVQNVIWQPSGVREDFFERPNNQEKEYDVIAVGSLFKVKNFDLLLDIATLRPNYQFIIVGDGNMKEHLLQRCQAENIINVKFAGYLLDEKLINAYDSSKIFLSTSLTEGTPTSMMEAMVRGLPVITTPSNDYSQIIKQHVNGNIVEFDKFKIAETIDNILTNEELYISMSQHNKNVAYRFGWENVANNITKLMEESLEKVKGNL